MSNTVEKTGLAVAKNSGAMEADTILKHGRMSKIQKSSIKLSVAMFAICALVAFGACKSSVPSVEKGAKEVYVPLSEPQYKSNKDFFRATQIGKSPDLSTAKKIALQNAKAELGGLVESTIKAVSENYVNQRQVGEPQEFEAKFEEISRAVVKQTLTDVRVIGEKVYQEKDGKYTYHIAIEMSKEPVAKGLSDRLSNDAKTKLDFDQYKFRQILDEEMEKMGNN